MKYLLLILPLFLLGFYQPSENRALKQDASDNDTIVYKPGIKVNWNDFKGEPQNRGARVAMTYSGFAFSFHSDEYNFKLKINVYMIRSKSWTKTDDSFVLQHERGHFDITEISARKFWKILKAKHLDHVKNSEAKKKYLAIKELYHTIANESEEMQDQYDKETNHSIIKEEQIKWTAKINKQLEELPSYEDGVKE